MADHEMLLLIFAPATVGLIVTSLRRASVPSYWAGLGGLLILIVFGAGRLFPVPPSELTGPLTLAVVLLVTPTLVAFGIGRMVRTTVGGAYLFTATCTAYLVGLGLAAALCNIAGSLMP
jgi:hypothetical protein